MQREIGATLFQARGVALSHDGGRAAVATIGTDEDSAETNADIWIVDLRRELATRLAADEDPQGDPAWSPDDRRIAYSTFRGMDDVTIHVRQADGSGVTETLIEDAYAASLSDDWSVAAIMTGNIADDTWIATQRVGDDASRREFQNGDSYDADPALRPGGGLIAYLSGNIMAREEFVFLRPFPEGEGRWQISTKVGGSIHWNRAGDRLYFVEGVDEDQTLMEVTVTIDGGRIELGDATPLFSMEENRLSGFDLSPDGQSFLMLQRLPEPETGAVDEGIVVVQNWIEEFR